MEEVIITVIISVIIGVVIGMVEVKINKLNNNRKNVVTNEINDFVDADTIQRRGSWRYSLDQILYSSVLRKEIENEANIKLC